MEKDKKELMQSIGESINEVVKVKELQNIKSLSRHNPEKVAKILYLYATGVSQTRIVKKSVSYTHLTLTTIYSV